MRLNIAQKIFGIALVILALMTTIAVYSIHLTAKISEELEIVAGRHMPVSETVTRINVHMLEQGLVLQRLFVLTGEHASEKAVLRGQKRFEALGVKIADEFAEARRLLHEEEKGPARIRKTIETFERVLAGIEREHTTFEKHGWKLVEAREAADLHLFDPLLAELNKRQDAIDAEIATLRRHVEGLTNDAVVRADREEKILLAVNSVLTVLATLLGLGFALIATRVLVRAVRNLVTGMEAVEGGDLDTEVRVTTRDEVGRLTGSFNHMVGELRMKERIKDIFGKYMDPRIVTSLLDNPEFAEPGGERREMTVMFIDLKGFTSISEALSPDDLVMMINRFFGHMTNAISENKGVVDKFMGDAVMAYWGPPFTEADEHAALACRAALEALDYLDRFRLEVKSELGAKAGSIEIDLRIGVSTGEMVVGTVGSPLTRNFTIMGDTVNLGARLEGANKAYGTRVMISERTRELAGEKIAVRELDLIRVKGKNEPTRVYELLHGGGDLPPYPVSTYGTFHAGLNAYRRRDWDEAETAFKSCIDTNSGDPAASVYLDRVAQLRADPPSEEWDGVWVFETK